MITVTILCLSIFHYKPMHDDTTMIAQTSLESAKDSELNVSHRLRMCIFFTVMQCVFLQNILYTALC